MVANLFVAVMYQGLKRKRKEDFKIIVLLSTALLSLIILSVMQNTLIITWKKRIS